jgi:hypothetical protein
MERKNIYTNNLNLSLSNKTELNTDKHNRNTDDVGELLKLEEDS